LIKHINFNIKKVIPILVVLLLVMLYAIFSLYELNKKSYLDEVTQKYNSSYNIVLNQYKEFSEIFYTGIIKKINIVKYISNIENHSEIERDNIRLKIKKEIDSRKDILNKKHLLSFNIILSNRDIFFHYRYFESKNKKLSDKRKLFYLVKKTKEFQSSFEVGKRGAGYRFIYPLLDKNNNFLGMVELAFDASAITSTLMKQYDVLSNFFIKSSNFDTMSKAYLKYFKSSHHKGFVYDLRVLKELKKTSKKELKKLIPSKETINTLRKNFDKKTPQTIYDSNINSTFSSIPIINSVTKEVEAVLTIRAKGDTLKVVYKYYTFISLFLIFMFLSIFYIFYLYQQKNNKDKLLIVQSKQALMGEMLENIAHQWRQPLSVITTSASGLQLQKELNTLTDERFEEGLKTIQDSAIHLSNTIDDFRSFYKNETSESIFNIKDTIDKSLMLISSKFKNRDIQVIKKLENIDMYGYPNEMIQVLMNIFSNAKDAFEDKDDYSRIIIIEISKLNNEIEITIQDNAGGIPENIIDKIFEQRFTTKAEQDGTGIGLFMSKAMVEKAGGDLSVENREFMRDGDIYKGACFIITLPFTKENNV